MRKATLMSVCLNSFVMKVVSLSVYVNVAHLHFSGWSSGCGGEGGVFGGGVIGKSLLRRMLWIFSSHWYSAVSSL